MAQETESDPQPNAVYKIGRATVRMHGTCTNIRSETERFLKQVQHLRKVNRRKAKEKEAKHNADIQGTAGTIGNEPPAVCGILRHPISDNPKLGDRGQEMSALSS